MGRMRDDQLVLGIDRGSDVLVNDRPAWPAGGHGARIGIGGQLAIGLSCPLQLDRVELLQVLTQIFLILFCTGSVLACRPTVCIRSAVSRPSRWRWMFPVMCSWSRLKLTAVNRPAICGHSASLCMQRKQTFR